MTMETIFYPEESRWEELCARPRTDTSALEAVCREIFDQVRTEGDAALRRYTERFDRVKVSDLAVSAGKAVTGPPWNCTFPPSVPTVRTNCLPAF